MHLSCPTRSGVHSELRVLYACELSTKSTAIVNDDDSSGVQQPEQMNSSCPGRWRWAVKRIDAAKFKEQCLALLDRLTPEGLVITKHGKPVARVIPYPRPSGDLIGTVQEKLEIHGDIMSTGLAWDADAEPSHTHVDSRSPRRRSSRRTKSSRT